jgi:prepilin-type N-terminal cleavage/methylation domain-containing protein
MKALMHQQRQHLLARRQRRGQGACRRCGLGWPCSGGRRHSEAPQSRGGQAGFTLVELLISLAIGLLFCTVVLRSLVLAGPQGALLARHLRERGLQARTLELLRADLLRAETLRLGNADGSACALAGREPLLQIETAAGPITYSQGRPPSPIWRGRVLMRCGPAFGLDGEPTAGQAQNRVVIDALVAEGLRIESSGQGVLHLRLEQDFGLVGGGGQRLSSGRVVTAGAMVLP